MITKDREESIYYTARATLKCLSLIKRAVKNIEKGVAKIENQAKNRRKGNE